VRAVAGACAANAIAVAIPCHPVPSRAIPCHPVPSRAIPCHPVPSRAIPCHPVPSRRPQRWKSLRLPLGGGAQTRALGSGGRVPTLGK
jgi:hypothetical protein